MFGEIKNHGFKLELIKRWGSQIEGARAIGITNNKTSKLVRGHEMPSPSEWLKLEAALGKSPAHRLIKRHKPVMIQGSK